MHHNQNMLQILLPHTTVDSFVQKSATNFGRFIYSYWVRFVSIVALNISCKFFIQNYPQCNVQDMYDRIGMNPLRIHGLDVSLKIQILFTYREAEFWQTCEIRTCKVVLIEYNVYQCKLYSSIKNACFSTNQWLGSLCVKIIENIHSIK